MVHLLEKRIIGSQLLQNGTVSIQPLLNPGRIIVFGAAIAAEKHIILYVVAYGVEFRQQLPAIDSRGAWGGIEEHLRAHALGVSIQELTVEGNALIDPGPGAMAQREPQTLDIHKTLPVEGAVILGGISSKPQDAGMEDDGFPQFRDLAYQRHTVRIGNIIVITKHFEAHDTAAGSFFRNLQSIRFMGVDPEYREQPIGIVPADIQHLIHSGFRVITVGFALLGVMGKQHTAIDTAIIHLLQ